MKNGKFLLIFIVLLSLPIFMVGIHRSLGITDEACYAEVAKEMIKSGDWLTPYRWGRPFYEKPPLLFWIIAFFFKILGIGTVTARLPITFFGIGVIIFTYLLGKEICEEQNKLSLFYSCLILLTTPSMITYGHGALMDIPLLFFILVGIYCLIKSEQRPSLAIFFGISLGLGIMMKGAMAFVLIFGLIPYIVLRKKWQYFTNLYLYAGLILTVLIVLPWHIYEIFKNGKDFIQEYFVYHTFKRMAQPLHSTVVNKASGIFFYPVTILLNFLPWSAFLLQSLWKDIKKVKISNRSALIISWTVTNLIVLTLVRTRLDQYAIIFYPFLALSVGAYLPYAIKEEKSSNKLSLKVGSIVYLCLGIIFVTASFIVFFKFKEYVLYTIPALIFASVILFFSLIYFFRDKFHSWKDWILRILGGGFYAGWVISLIFVPFWDYAPDFRPFTSSVSRIISSQEKIYAVVPDEILYMRDPLHFYLNNPIEDLGEDNVQKVWDNHPSLILITHRIIYKKKFSSLSQSRTLLESKEWLLLKKGN